MRAHAWRGGLGTFFAPVTATLDAISSVPSPFSPLLPLTTSPSLRTPSHHLFKQVPSNQQVFHSSSQSTVHPFKFSKFQFKDVLLSSVVMPPVDGSKVENPSCCCSHVPCRAYRSFSLAEGSGLRITRMNVFPLFQLLFALCTCTIFAVCESGGWSLPGTNGDEGHDTWRWDSSWQTEWAT